MKKSPKYLKQVFLILLLAVICFLNIFYWSQYFNQGNYRLTTNDILNEPLSTDSDDSLAKLDLKYYQNLYQNDEIQGRLTLENTDLDVLFAQTEDNDYYLTHDLKRNNYKLGATYMDFRVNINSRKILIYGHNSKYQDTPFKLLENYLDKNYYNDHKYLTILTDKVYYRYEIFSVALIASDYEYFEVDISDYQSHYTKLKSQSIYDTGVEISATDDTLILQTCSNFYQDTFLVISAKKIETK